MSVSTRQTAVQNRHRVRVRCVRREATSSQSGRGATEQAEDTTAGCGRAFVPGATRKKHPRTTLALLHFLQRFPLLSAVPPHRLHITLIFCPLGSEPLFGYLPRYPESGAHICCLLTTLPAHANPAEKRSIHDCRSLCTQVASLRSASGAHIAA